MLNTTVTAMSIKQIADELDRRDLRFILVTETADGGIEMYVDNNAEPSLTLIGALEQTKARLLLDDD